MVVPSGGKTPAKNVALLSATTTEQVASPSAQPSSSEPDAQESSLESGSVVPNDVPLQEPLNESEPDSETSLRRSQRSRQFAIPDDYEVYTSVDTKTNEIYVSEDIDA
jgi:hypothetical protein